MTRNAISQAEGQVSAVKQERICQWLRLPCDLWPPDHYTLLGLMIGEGDTKKIDQSVQERMKIIRGYQLSHPELATEALNRLAEAYDCLSDASAKEQYDIGLGIVTATNSVAIDSRRQLSKQKNADDDTVTNSKPTVLDWKESTPPPVRDEKRQAPPKPLGHESVTIEIESQPIQTNDDLCGPSQRQLVQESLPADVTFEAIRRSWRRRKGLDSRNTLYDRVLASRSLIRNWLRLGRFVAAKNRPLQPGEEKDFLRVLARIEYVQDRLPHWITEPGQPGYRVHILSQDEDPVREFNQLEIDERERLSQDWKLSLTLLRSYLSFIRSEVRRSRTESLLHRMTRPVRRTLNDYPGWTYLSVAVLMALIAIIVWVQF